ncbi:tetratricopeptide repeat protein, partial [Roseisolibacter sp. H3M3-2]|uniref:tetratricopeptide repeat protein n=1 Tax=Roseisolibacter sp. H3M3-2 TaxID=3031323 RepID=UPI0023DAC74E
LLAALVVPTQRRGGGAEPAADTGAPPVVAVGLVADFRGPAGGASRPLTDMLATNLARVAGVQVISSARLQELLQRSGAADTVAGSFVGAARQAGAGELIDGTLYARGDGTLRLDLRRVHLASGAVRAALTVEGRDLFALADSGTAQLLRGMRLDAPRGSVADVTTRSETAYRLYTEGVRAYYAGDLATASRLLGESRRADSTFAMAALYHAVSLYSSDWPAAASAMERASVLAERASERDRLFIRSLRAAGGQLPELAPLADSLVARYPALVEGYYFRGEAAQIGGDYLRARPLYERAIAMDSLGVGTGAGPCITCSAMNSLIGVLHAADSLPAALRVARRWVRLRPDDAQGWSRLAEVLGRLGRWPEAEQAHLQALTLGPGLESVRLFPMFRAYRKHDFVEAERLTRAAMGIGTATQRTEAVSTLTTVLRYQGRLREALDAARRYHALQLAAYRGHPELGTPPVNTRLEEAIVLLEAGRPLESARIFEEMAAAPRLVGQTPAGRLRQRAWTLSHAMTARAAGGDTAGLRARAGELEATRREAGLTHPHYRHYPAGLLAIARGDTAGAITELRAGIASWTVGYSRATMTLARLLLATGRPAEAVAALQPVLRGDVEGQTLYLTFPAVHEARVGAVGAIRSPQPAAAAGDSAAAH